MKSANIISSHSIKLLYNIILSSTTAVTRRCNHRGYIGVPPSRMNIIYVIVVLAVIIIESLLEEGLRRQGLLIGIDGPRVVRLGRGRVVRHDVRLSGYDAIMCGVLWLRVTVLRMVKFLPHHVVQRATLEVQYLLERPSEVSIQRGVDYLNQLSTGKVNNNG